MLYSMDIHYLQWILEPSTNSKLIYGPKVFPSILIRGISEPFCHWIDTWDANSQEGGCNLAHSFKVLFHAWLMLCFLMWWDRTFWYKIMKEQNCLFRFISWRQRVRNRRETRWSLQDQLPSAQLLETKLTILPLGNTLCGLWIYWCNQSFPWSNHQFKVPLLHAACFRGQTFDSMSILRGHFLSKS